MAQASAQPTPPHRIDTHHHILPPRYVEAVGVGRITEQAPRLSRSVVDWTPKVSMENMDRNGIAIAITSVSAPGVWFGEAAPATSLARYCNEYAANIVRNYPGRFGMFAALPLPDIEASLREIEYASDALEADGFALMTCYGNTWPGDRSFAPVLDELNRRKSVVYFHPNVSEACSNLLPGIPASTLEFPLDTTRAVVSLLYSGSLARCPDIRFVFSHAGGAVPFLAHRLANLENEDAFRSRLPKGAMYEMKKLYYDTALSVSRPALAGLSHFVATSQMLFGSDFPFAPGMTEVTIDRLAKFGFRAEDLHAIECRNALDLFPRLRCTVGAL